MKLDKSIQYKTTLILFLLIGTILRLWKLSSQVFLDDEWHAFGFVMQRTFSEVLFQHGMGANSIPVNIWFWLTLHTIGWSEIVLKLPSIICGIAAIIILPLLVSKLWGKTVSLIFAAQLAISPIAIFYARIDRPFAPAMFWGGTSILLTLLWIQKGKPKYIFFSVISGFLGIYYHLYTVIPVGSVLLVAAVASFKPLARSIGIFVSNKDPWPTLWFCSGVMTLLLGIFVVLPNLMNPWWMGVQGMSHADFGTLKTFVEFIAGTARFGLPYFVYLLLPIGALLILQGNRTQGVALIIPLVLFFMVIANYTQDGAHAGIQAARYGIVIFPICFIIISVALEWLAAKAYKIFPITTAEYFIPALLILIWLPFISGSPLWSIYRSTNNFTSHSGYQYTYKPISWDHSPERSLTPGISISYEEMPILYRQPQLYAGCKGIIEYPMAIGDHFNLYFYYQHFHQLPVLVGYTRQSMKPAAPPRGEWVYANNTIDYVLTRVPQHLSHKTDSWNTMVDLAQLVQNFQNYRGWLIVLHKNPVREATEHIPEFGGYKSPDLPETILAADIIQRLLGSPTIESNHIIAWKVQ